MPTRLRPGRPGSRASCAQNSALWSRTSGRKLEHRPGPGRCDRGASERRALQIRASGASSRGVSRARRRLVNAGAEVGVRRRPRRATSIARCRSARARSADRRRLHRDRRRRSRSRVGSRRHRPGDGPRAVSPATWAAAMLVPIRPIAKLGRVRHAGMRRLALEHATHTRCAAPPGSGASTSAPSPSSPSRASRSTRGSDVIRRRATALDQAQSCHADRFATVRDM